MVGEFKDDRLQTHTHTYKNVPYLYQYTVSGSLRSNLDGNFTYLNNGTSYTTDGVNSGRYGDTTRTKQKGVRFVIKVL